MAGRVYGARPLGPRARCGSVRCAMARPVRRPPGRVRRRSAGRSTHGHRRRGRRPCERPSRDDDRLSLLPYLVSFRARPQDGVRRLPLPAAAAHRLWSHARPPACRSMAGRRRRRPRHELRGAADPAPPAGVGLRLLVPPQPRAGASRRRAGRDGCCARSVRRGAVVHASSHATADAVRELFPGADVRVVHLGRRSPMPAGHAAAARSPSSTAATFVRRGRRPSSDARTCRCSCGRSARSPDAPRVCGWCSPAATATTGRRSTPPSTRCPARSAPRVLRHRLRRRRRALAGCSTTPGCSPTRRSTRGSASRCSTRCSAGLPIVASTRRLDPRGRRRRRAARRRRRPRRRWRPRLLTGARPTRPSASGLVAAGARRLAEFSWRSTADQLIGLYRRARRTFLRRCRVITVLCGGVGAARFLRGAARPARSGAGHRRRQHRRRHRAARAVDLARPRHDHLHARRRDRPRARAGDWSTRPGGDGGARALRRRSARAGRRPRPRGSTSATAIWPPTSTARPGSPRAPRSPRSPPRSRGPGTLPERLVADDRRPGGRRWSTCPTAARSRSRTTSCGCATRCRSAASASTAPTPPCSSRRPPRRSSDAADRDLAPSNPLVSIGPIRALPGVDELLAARRDVGGGRLADRRRRRLKGPADRMLVELGHEASVVGVARLYARIAGDAGDRSGRRPPRRRGRGRRHAVRGAAVDHERSGGGRRARPGRARRRRLTDAPDTPERTGKRRRPDGRSHRDVSVRVSIVGRSAGDQIRDLSGCPPCDGP